MQRLPGTVQALATVVGLVVAVDPQLRELWIASDQRNLGTRLMRAQKGTCATLAKRNLSCGSETTSDSGREWSVRCQPSDASIRSKDVWLGDCGALMPPSRFFEARASAVWQPPT